MGTQAAEVPALRTWLGAARHPGATLAKGPPGTSAPVLSFLGSLPSSRSRSLRPLMQLWKSQPPSGSPGLPGAWMRSLLHLWVAGMKELPRRGRDAQSQRCSRRSW